MFFNCLEMCGIKSPYVCKNIHCSGNPHYVPPKPKDRPKQGAGRPSTKAKMKIKKYDANTPMFFGE